MKTKLITGAGIALALVLIVALVSAQSSIGTWIPSWGVTNIFAVGSSTNAASFRAKADSVTVGKPITFNANSRWIVSGTSIATIDSFTTTAAVDTIAMPGASSSDLYIVSWRIPSYSTTPDTGSSPYSARYLTTDTVLVSRGKLTPESTLKSGAHYGIIAVNK